MENKKFEVAKPESVEGLKVENFAQNQSKPK